VSKVTLHDRVKSALERQGLIPPGSRVLAAVSGGADSVALLLLLHGLAGPGGFSIAGLAHLNHGLRGEESDGDEAFCRGLAASLGLAIEVGHADAAALARASRTSVEAAARRARYEFFERAATRLGADLVATGHTRDDQAETFLLRVLRGAGASGLAGIRPKRGRVIRPLLDVRRREIEAFLARRRQPFRSDSSNQDLRIPRNWVRHQLLPLLNGRLGADVAEVLAREAAVLRDEDEWLERLAEEAEAGLSTPGPGSRVRLQAEALARLPAALARRVVRRVLAKVDDTRFHGFDHVEQVLAAASALGPGRASDLPGVRVERNGPEVVLYSRGSRARTARASFRYELPVPGVVAVPECGCVIRAVPRRWSSSQTPLAKAVSADGQAAVIAASAAAGGLAVRSRRPGDAFRPFGMAGRKKLQDVLVDRKVPRADRDCVPLVVDAADTILWVGGHAVAEEARATPRTRSVVVLRIDRLAREEHEA